MAYRAGKKSSNITMIRYVDPLPQDIPDVGPDPIPFTMSCTTATIDPQMWVTESALYTQSYGSTYTYGFESAIPGTQAFRCFDDGRMLSFNEILTSTGQSLPSNNTYKLWENDGSNGETIPFGGLKVKRPNCVCTQLKRFVLHRRSNLSSGNMKKITFEDGYEPLFLGRKLMVLSSRQAPDHSSSIPSFRTVDELEPGDFVLKCTNTEATMRTGTDCLVVEATASVSPSGYQYYAVALETTWPQDQWSNSSVRGVIMLENGIYVATNPAGGSF